MGEENTWKDRGMSTNFEAPDDFIGQLVDTDPNETAEWNQS